MTKISRSAALDLLGDLIPESARPKRKPRRQWRPISTTIIFTEDRCKCGLTHRRPATSFLAEEACFIGDRELIRQTTADPLFLKEDETFDLTMLPIEEKIISGTDLPYCSTCSPYLLLLGGQPFADQHTRTALREAEEKKAHALRAAASSTQYIKNETADEIFLRSEEDK